MAFGSSASSSFPWQPASWQGEPALVSVAGAWKAVVSIPRARLVYFGPVAGEPNLLFSTPTLEDPAGWAGHRLWLGPQKDWSVVWPPPPAWEQSAAASVAETAGTLELVLFPAGDGWPELTRTYAWSASGLVCGARLHGGAREAQVIHIVQVPQRARISAAAYPHAGCSAGYVRLPSAAGPFARTFDPPPHVARRGDALELQHLGVVEKLGFGPQPLSARIEGYALHVSRGPESGRALAAPDEGFYSQVYLGRPDEPFIELEQLTPTWSPQSPARASIVLSATRE